MSDSQKSLFEYLGIADQERMHTQVLAWLLNPSDSPLKNDELKSLFKELFNYEIDELAQVSVSTEYKSIDLVIKSFNLIIGVENKLKSSQGVDQLKKYKATLDKVNVNNRLYFLTFSGEIGSAEECHNLDYQFIYNALEKYIETNIYIKDYLSLLNKMLAARSYFLTNVTKCHEVFRRSGLSTEARLEDIISSDNEHVLFICKNRLERLYVQIYLRKIMSQLKSEGLVSSFIVSESNGQALIQVYFDDLNFKVQNESFVPGFQYQSSTIKYTIVINSKDYKTSEKLDESNPLVLFLDDKFDSSTFQINKAKTRAYRSYSQKVNPDFLFQELSTVTESFKNNIKDCYNKWKEIHKVHLEKTSN